tara:strand:- start:31 stop:819 length:789 start_codon:yes stop_codon:yes gene_type:complete
MVISNMIKISWPPGCYGSYVMQSIYAYSNLGDGKIIIDPTGSSHSFRSSNNAKKFFDSEHVWSKDVDVHVNPVSEHHLDYLNNQLVKQENNDVISSFKKSFGDGFTNQIFENWRDTSHWVLREWVSFWIIDQLSAAYVPQPTVKLTTNDLFDTNKNVFSEIINRIGLTVTTDSATMKVNQQQWIAQQRYHNSQYRCNTWVEDILNDRNTPTPCQTILDEAYVQHCLREQGYEIRCDGLDNFPKTSSKLKELIYENSNANNKR